MLGGDSITIHVGHARGTQVHYRFPDVDGVWKFLDALFPIISPPALKKRRDQGSG